MATLVVNRSESYCLSCPREKNGAIPWESGHHTYIGWHGSGPGCGELWTAVSSDYVGGSFDNIEEHYFGWKNLEGLPVIKPPHSRQTKSRL